MRNHTGRRKKNCDEKFGIVIDRVVAIWLQTYKLNDNFWDCFFFVPLL